MEGWQIALFIIGGLLLSLLYAVVVYDDPRCAVAECRIVKVDNG